MTTINTIHDHVSSIWHNFVSFNGFFLRLRLHSNEYFLTVSLSLSPSLFSDFLFPKELRDEDLKICEDFEVKAFCKDGVEPALFMSALATASSLIIILSLIHYLMCLSANYAHIRDHEKFQELQEIQNLNDMEYSAASKERF